MIARARQSARTAILLVASALALVAAPGASRAQGQAKGRGEAQADKDKKDQKPAKDDTTGQNGSGQNAGGPNGGGQAPAQDTAACAILEIEASNGKPGLDDALKPLAKKLKKPPFASWKTFRMLKRHDEVLQRMKAVTLPLVTKSKMTLLYRDRSGDPGKKIRLRLTFTLDDKDGKRKVDGSIRLDSGDSTLIGGDALSDGGTYIVAVSCKAP